MSLVPFECMIGNDYWSTVYVNPRHVVMVVPASPSQTWLRLVNSAAEHLVEGGVEEVAKRLYDPPKLLEGLP